MHLVLLLQLIWISGALYMNIESLNLMDEGEMPLISHASWVNTFLFISTGILLVMFFMKNWRGGYRFLSVAAGALAIRDIWYAWYETHYSWSSEMWRLFSIGIACPAVLAAVLVLILKPSRRKRTGISPSSAILPRS